MMLFTVVLQFPNTPHREHQDLCRTCQTPLVGYTFTEGPVHTLTACPHCLLDSLVVSPLVKH